MTWFRKPKPTKVVKLMEEVEEEKEEEDGIAQIPA
jgi:hypothetical protein